VIGFALALALAAAPVVLPTAQGLSVERRVAVLAATNVGIVRFRAVVYEDPALRAELRRVGFATGCALAKRAAYEVTARHEPALRPPLEQAIAQVVPTQKIEEARALSFLVMPLLPYQARVIAAYKRTAAAPLAEARRDVRRTFLGYARPLPAADPAANEIMPRPDIAAALGVRGKWDLDNPLQLEMACAEQTISPTIRPTITTGGVSR
jgi:hypothetical protein